MVRQMCETATVCCRWPLVVYIVIGYSANVLGRGQTFGVLCLGGPKLLSTDKHSAQILFLLSALPG